MGISLDAVKNNILTAESPIEVFIDNISQTQIDEDGPYDYAMWARGILRQVPDISLLSSSLGCSIRRSRSLPSPFRDTVILVPRQGNGGSPPNSSTHPLIARVGNDRPP